MGRIPYESHSEVMLRVKHEMQANSPDEAEQTAETLVEVMVEGLKENGEDVEEFEIVDITAYPQEIDGEEPEEESEDDDSRD